MDTIKRILWGHQLIALLHNRMRSLEEIEGPQWKPMDLKSAKPRSIWDVIEKERRIINGSQT